MKTIATEIYRAADISCDSSIETRFKELEAMGFGASAGLHGEDAVLVLDRSRISRGAPTGHIVPVREVRLSAGAEFIVVITGEIMTMPGLPQGAVGPISIRLNSDGQIEGLF